jgi:mRNA interferase MazF
MTRFQRRDVVLVVVPFADGRGSKLRPAAIVGAPHPSDDEILVPLSSRVTRLAPGEFVIEDWSAAGLNVPSKVRRFLLTQTSATMGRRIGSLSPATAERLDESLRVWLGL